MPSLIANIPFCCFVSLFLDFLGAWIRDLLLSLLPAVVSAKTSAGEWRLERALSFVLWQLLRQKRPGSRQHPQHELCTPALQGLFPVGLLDPPAPVVFVTLSGYPQDQKRLEGNDADEIPGRAPLSAANVALSFWAQG